MIVYRRNMNNTIHAPASRRIGLGIAILEGRRGRSALALSSFYLTVFGIVGWRNVADS